MSDSLEQRFNRLREAGKKIPESSTNSAPGSRPVIQSVPIILRCHKNLEKHFEPRVLAIGPIHHGKSQFQEWEKIKYRLAADFVKDSGKSDESLYKQIKENVEEFKQCYDKKTTECYDGDEETLAWMFFIDGCSILQFILKFFLLEEEFEVRRDQMNSTYQDLFMLENQIPYKVLDILMSSSIKKEDLRSKVEEFVYRVIIVCTSERGRKRVKQQNPTTERVQEPIHLLGLLRTRMIGSKTPEEMSTSHTTEPLRPSFSNVQELRAACINFWRCEGRRLRAEPLQPSFRNVQELKAAGIHFRRSEGRRSREISFKSLCFAGFLSLPAMDADELPFFLNLIAYEMCPDFQNGYEVSSYFCFLSSLITHPEDAKQLRSARIIYSTIQTDEALAQLFNEIGPDLVSNPSIIHIDSRIEQHYKTKWKVWIAQFFEDHFSNPWAMIAFIGALTALFLSAIQTWYSVISYHHPKS